MESRDKQDERIRFYLLEEESSENTDVFFEEAQHSDHDEIDHVSESEHNTDSDFSIGFGDNTDDDPNYSPSSDSDDGGDEEVYTRNVNSDNVDNIIEAVVAGAGERNNFFNLVYDPIDDIIESVVHGAGEMPSENDRDLIGKDLSTVWMKNPYVRPNNRTRAENIVKHLPGPINKAKHAKTPIECFNLMIDDQIVEIIVENTNIFINNISDKYNRKRDCLPTDKIEIKSFFGLLILAGATRDGHRNLIDLWGRDGFGMEVFYSTMSLRRFTFLLRTIRFDNILDRAERRATDKLAPFREVFEIFNNNCNDNYSLSEFTTIDEQLVAFRGRCSFRQFMKNKPAKYGLKIFTLTDAKMFYVKAMEIYVGNQPENSLYQRSNKPFDVVMRLVKSILGSGRNITADNWFTSIPLVTELLTKNLTYVGTVKKDKRELPPDMVYKKRDPYTSIFGFQEDMTIVSYAPANNRCVVLVSSMHHDASIDPDSGDLKKPDIITFYNQTKSGVDVIDEKCGTYSTSRRCLRWPLVLFYRLLDISCINAQVIYLTNDTVGKNTPRRLFLKELGMSLVKHQVVKRSSNTSLPKTLRASVCKVARVEPPPTTVAEPNARVRCTVCPRNKDNKTKFRCEKCQAAMCLSHLKTVCEPCSVMVLLSDDSE